MTLFRKKGGDWRNLFVRTHGKVQQGRRGKCKFSTHGWTLKINRIFYWKEILTKWHCLVQK